MGKFSRHSSPSSVPRRRQSISGETRTPQPTVDDSSTFHRNRTITGSPSSHVRGAVEGSGQLKSGRVHAHALKHQRRKVGGIFLVVAAISALLLGIILQFTATVAIATPGATTAVDTETYRKTVQDYFAFRPLERLRFLTNEDELTKYMRSTSPEVETVRVEGGGGFATSVFSVSLRHPLASWTIDNTQYFVDEKGVSFQKNVFNSPAISISDESGVPVTAGVSIASNRFLSYVGQTIGAFQAEGVRVEKVIIPANTTRQIEVVLAGQGYPLKLSIDRQIEGQVEDGVRAVRYIEAQGKSPKYIDVRVSGKAFYKE